MHACTLIHGFTFMDSRITLGLAGPIACIACEKSPPHVKSTHRRVFKEETFGPLLPLFKFSSEQEVVQLANNTEYGLAAYFFTRDLGRAWRVAEDLQFGAWTRVPVLADT